MKLAIQRLYDAGGRNFLLINLPDMARSPFAAANHTENNLHALALNHNQFLHDAFMQLKKLYPDANFVFFNLYDVFNEMYDHYQDYHYTNRTDPCVTNPDIPGFNKMNSSNHAITSADSKKIANVVLNLALSSSKGGATVCPNPDEYLFWDPVHPTSRTHAYFADKICHLLAEEGFKFYDSFSQQYKTPDCQ